MTNKYQEEKKILDGYAFLDPKFEPEDINNFEFFVSDVNTIKKALELISEGIL